VSEPCDLCGVVGRSAGLVMETRGTGRPAMGLLQSAPLGVEGEVEVKGRGGVNECGVEARR